MTMDKILKNTWKASGAVLTVVGTASVGWLAFCGMTAPLREAYLRQSVDLARQKGERIGDKRGFNDGYEQGKVRGHQQGLEQGYEGGHIDGYDKGYLDAIGGKLYAGSTPKVLEELGLDPAEHACELIRQKAKEAEEQAEADWDILERIFSKKGDKSITLGQPTCPPPVPLDPNDVSTETTDETAGTTTPPAMDGEGAAAPEAADNESVIPDGAASEAGEPPMSDAESVSPSADEAV